VAAELEPHRRQQAALEVGLASRGEALEERGREDVRRHGLVDGRIQRPAPLARVRGDVVTEGEVRVSLDRDVVVVVDPAEVR